MKKLKQVTLGKNIKTIGTSAFKNCNALEFTFLPKKVTKIGKQAFKGCGKMKYLVIRSKKLKNVGKQAFAGVSSGAKVKTPKTKWREYASLLRKSGLSSSALFLIDPVKIPYDGETY